MRKCGCDNPLLGKGQRAKGKDASGSSLPFAPCPLLLDGLCIHEWKEMAKKGAPRMVALAERLVKELDEARARLKETNGS